MPTTKHETSRRWGALERRARAAAMLTALGVLLTAFAPAVGQEFSDQAVAAAIERGQEYLFKVQKNGRWPIMNNYPVGPTALITYALLESGVNPQDPRLRKPLEFLANANTHKTYSLGLRCQVWLSAMRHDDRYRRFLRDDVQTLLRSTANGSYGYDSYGRGRSSGDNSNSQYGLLGVWAGALADMDIPREYWTKVMQHWMATQCGDGGWEYRNRSARGKTTMTAAGLASTYVCFENLFQERFLGCRGTPEFKPIDRGLAWFDKNFARTVGGGLDLYYLYGVERVALASGEKYFGKTDWYKAAATSLLAAQAADGSWSYQHGGKPVGTAFALLILVRGRHPVLFNKLRYEGDWNNRPRDLASLTWWISRQFETTVNWQIINLDVPVAEWHDAPILYISGSDAPEFSDADIEKLRTFVLQGGTIFSVAECGGRRFTSEMRKVYAEMLPEFPMRELPRTHVLYNVYHELRNRVGFSMADNGIRPLAVHTSEDLPKIWQLRDYSQAWAFEAASNVFMYVTNRGALRARGTRSWPGEPNVAYERTVRVARLKHAGVYDPEPLAYQRLSRLLADETQTKLEVLGPMDVAELPEADVKIATLTGVGPLKLTDTQRRTLESWVRGGGTLVIDAGGGDRTFAEDAEKLLEQMFGSGGLRSRTLRRMAFNSPLYKLTLEDGKQDLSISEVDYRQRTIPRLGKLNADLPNLQLVQVDGRTGVIYSREDITGGLVGVPSYLADGYAPGGPGEPGSAYRIMRNILLYLHKTHQKSQPEDADGV